MLRQLKLPYQHPQTLRIGHRLVGRDDHLDKSQYLLVHHLPHHLFLQVRGTDATPKMSQMMKGNL